MNNNVVSNTNRELSELLNIDDGNVVMIIRQSKPCDDMYDNIYAR